MDLQHTLQTINSPTVSSAVNRLFSGRSQPSSVKSPQKKIQNKTTLKSQPLVKGYLTRSKSYHLKLCVLKYHQEVISDSGSNAHTWDGNYLFKGDLCLENKWSEMRSNQEIMTLIMNAYPSYTGHYRHINIPRAGYMQLRIVSRSFSYSAKALWDTRTQSKTVYIMLDSDVEKIGPVNQAEPTSDNNSQENSENTASVLTTEIDAEVESPAQAVSVESDAIISGPTI
ncbi:uncharacterized protein LOC144363606 [Saccoglossus kowalevskii]